MATPKVRFNGILLVRMQPAIGSHERGPSDTDQLGEDLIVLGAV